VTDGPREIACDDDGLPVRQIAWDTTPCYVSFQRRTVTDNNGSRETYMMIVDTRDNRSVTSWTRAELEAVCRTGLEFVGAIPDGIYLAGHDDLHGG
jgi:hypothetical protein